MAAGDLITRDGQYEFNGILFNNGTNLMVPSTTGIFDLPDTKVAEFEQLDDDGGYLGTSLLAMRRIGIDVLVMGTATVVQQTLDQLKTALQPSDIDKEFVYQRPGIGKRVIMARPRKMGGFASDWSMAKTNDALSRGSILLVAPDPRAFTLPLATAVVTIPASALSASATATQLGYFARGAWPILSIAGPATNPRIQNAADGNRSIKIDIVISAGQTLVIDVKNRSVKLNGVDSYASVRSDNQWWRLMPGANLITYSRSVAPATASALTVTWGHTYL